MQADMVLERKLRVLHLGRHQEEKVTLGLAEVSKTSKSTPSDALPPTRPHLLYHPLSVQIYEPMGSSLMRQTTTPSKY